MQRGILPMSFQCHLNKTSPTLWSIYSLCILNQYKQRNLIKPVRLTVIPFIATQTSLPLLKLS